MEEGSFISDHGPNDLENSGSAVVEKLSKAMAEQPAELRFTSQVQ